jgi:hypothetical protein
VIDDEHHGPACRQALSVIARAVIEGRVNLASFMPQDYAMLAGALSKAADDEHHGPACRKALAVIADAVIEGQLDLASFESRHSAMLGVCAAELRRVIRLRKVNVNGE